MRIPQTFRLSIVVVLASLLTACGFHLRGNIPLSDGIKNMHVVAPDGTFRDLLEDRLTKLGANLTASDAGADVVLSVGNVALNRQVGTLDERGKANSYNLTLNVSYTLNDIAGTPIRKKTTVRELRRYDFDPNSVVESESEEAELQQNMEEELVLKIIRQLASITDYDPQAAKQKAATTN